MSDVAPSRWARTESGRLEPFDPARVRRSLFEATQAVGAPDPFLARELADGVFHFLAFELEGAVPTVAQIAEVTAKVVRELGHPALAAAYQARRGRAEEGGPYSAEVQAAAQAGLLGVDDASQLAACLPTGPRLLGLPVELVALEGVEGLTEARRAGLGAIINWNVAEESEGGLFAGPRVEVSWPDVMFGGSGVRAVNWHVHESEEGLAEALGWGRHGVEVGFVLRQPRRPVLFGAGLTRDCPAVLARVRLNVLALANQPALLADVVRFVGRLGTLARLAVEAGVQKRTHLRRLGVGSEGFLRERARLVAVVEGLDDAVRLFTNWGVANGGPSLTLACQIVQRLREALRDEGRAAQLETHLEVDVTGGAGMGTEAQLHAGAALHREADSGTLYWHPTEGTEPVALVREAWRRADVWRVVLV